MTQFYIGVKQVEAWEHEKDGVAGYAVKYPDGYFSWSPKEVFEAAYLPMGEDNDGTRITQGMVANFIAKISHVGRHGNHAVDLVTLRNGFTLIEESACVNPDNYDEEVGREIVYEKVTRRVWHLLGFLLAHARNGLTK